MDHSWKTPPSYGGYTRGCRCLECAAASRAHKNAYRKKNAEKVNASQRKWYAANREEFRKHQNEYRAARPEQNKAFEKARYARHKEARNAASREWGASNKERKKATNAAWYAANKEKVKKNVRRWQAVNQPRVQVYRKRTLAKPEVLAKKRTWHKRRSVKYRHSRQRRKARIRGAEGSHTIQEWEDLLRQYNYKCAHCGSHHNLTKDHIIPISKGGSDYASNLQPLCRSCNCSKGAKVEPEPQRFPSPTVPAESRAAVSSQTGANLEQADKPATQRLRRRLVATRTIDQS